MDNPTGTWTGETGGHAGLPFHDFFTTLKNNGFTVTTQQIIDTHAIINNYAGRVYNEAELCLYLLPVFAGDEDEQILFSQLFHKHFKPAEKAAQPVAETKKDTYQKNIKRHWRKYLLLYGFIALAILAVIVVAYRRYTTIDTSKISINLTEYDSVVKRGPVQQIFSVTPGQLLKIKTSCRYNHRGRTLSLDSRTTIDWGDSSVVEERNTHSYTRQGKYPLVAYVEVLQDYKVIRRDTLRRLVFVCSDSKTLDMEYGGNTRVPFNKPLRLQARFDKTNPPLYIKWVSTYVDLFYGDSYYITFPKPGDYNISCVAVYDSINSPCTIRRDILFTAFDPLQVRVADTTATDAVQQDSIPDGYRTNKTDYPFLGYLYICLAIGFGLIAILFTLLSEKEKRETGRLKKAVTDKYHTFIASLKNKKFPGVIPFRSKNYLPLHQTEINNTARLMRRRVNDNSRFLHIGKTIARSIENNGLLQPVTLPRTRQTEYLVLIDERHSNDQLVKVYEYLLLEFKKQNILVDTYYYNRLPDRLYNYAEPKGISLEKIFTKHQNHIVLLFGNARALVDVEKEIVKDHYLHLLNRWQHKAILTPIPYPDWGIHEKSILIPHIPVFPMDVEGLLLMAEQFTGNDNSRDIIARLNQHRSLFYSTAAIDFQTIAGLEAYCKQAVWANRWEAGKRVNVLLQWIAALAVHPKLSWEVIISIGKVILDKYDCSQELNYTSLLRVARINWMQDGSFPEPLRLELLKRLNADNEVLARETMLMLLEEIPASAMENSTAFEEKEVQRIIHEFSLYAHDPVFYSSYRESGFIYEQLRTGGRLNDTTTELYFKNADKRWSTLINKRSPDDNSNVNASAEEYFDSLEKENTLLGKFYMWLAIISLLVFVSSLFALRILYQWKTATDIFY